MTGFEWKEALDLKNGLAWDIYFLYSKDATWGDLPGYPDYWMNQIGIDSAISPRLNLDLLSENIARMMSEK